MTTTDTPPAAPPDTLRALDWARRPEIAGMLARAEEDGDTFGVFYAGFTAGIAAGVDRERERCAKICWKQSDDLLDRNDMLSEQGMAQECARLIRLGEPTP